MMLPDTIINLTKNFIEFEADKVKMVAEDKLDEKWDQLVYLAVFGDDQEKAAARWLIWEVGQVIGVKPASINDLYMARGREAVPLNFTVPAMNIRGMAYDTARAVFKTAKAMKVGTLVCELARSEMGYTDQTPIEYVSVVMAAAIREGWRGGLPIQGDHFQAKEAGPGLPKEGEIEAIKKLIQEALAAGFLNIDIDMSTLVDLTKPTEPQQQAPNISNSLEFIKLIRANELKGLTVSVGGEIGHIGGKNSTVAEFEAYINGFNQGLPSGMTGMSKISVATGTHHGGVRLADGTMANIPVDFKVLADVSKACRKLKIGGAVQHGASTLPENYFNEFVKAEAIEVHLATEFQNIMLDHPAFPKDLTEKMNAWMDAEQTSERKEGQTDDQFHYSVRKKCLGKFKKEIWEIEAKSRAQIREALGKKFAFLFKELGVTDSQELANKWIKGTTWKKSLADFAVGGQVKEVKGLSD